MEFRLGAYQPHGRAESVSSLESPPSTLFMRVVSQKSREIPLEVVRHDTRYSITDPSHLWGVVLDPEQDAKQVNKK
jgi:hypothetical protein